MNLVEQLIVEEAQQYIGQQEIKGNMGFKNSWFDKLMRSVGFRDTHAWCVYFCELVWHGMYKKYDERKLSDIKRIFTGGAVRTFRRFKEDQEWETSLMPKKGAIAIWQKWRNGKPTQYGHAAIVVDFSVNEIMTIDGNTDAKGGREGIEVAEKVRKINYGETKGLVLKGFIYPQGIEGT